jgi:hypothetical protein
MKMLDVVDDGSSTSSRPTSAILHLGEPLSGGQQKLRVLGLKATGVGLEPGASRESFGSRIRLGRGQRSTTHQRDAMA